MRILLKFRRKEGFINEKMLVKAVALSLVLGGVGFVANNAQAAGPIPGMPSETDMMKQNIQNNAARSVKNAKDIQKLEGDVATNKANITKNAENISNNTIAIQKEADARDYGDYQLNTKIDAEGQARVENDKLLNDKIDAEKKHVNLKILN